MIGLERERPLVIEIGDPLAARRFERRSPKYVAPPPSRAVVEQRLREAAMKRARQAARQSKGMKP